MTLASSSRRSALAALSIGLLALGACSHPDRGPAVPRADTARAQPLGIPNARFFADGDPAPIMQEAMAAAMREVAVMRADGRLKADEVPTKMPPVTFLAVSGGGDNGAFGAGLLKGWTATGTRPEFKLVTGVSTGALIAPFAFLGPDYDDELREVYTTMTPERIFRARGITAALFDDAMADTSPLADVIAKYADQKLFDAIGQAYQRGRLLMIGTTDLDAQRPVIWNIGAIAVSGKPGALDLFRKILRASAAIPGAFQPVMIDVELDGKEYQEMHVDGGAIAQLFLYPPSLDVASARGTRERRAYIIRNARLDPDYTVAERRTISIAGRAISTMLAASGYNDVLRTYFVTRRDGVDYNLAYIGADFVPPAVKTGEFDQVYMQALYAYGLREGQSGHAWHKVPPGLPAEQITKARGHAAMR
ncbi:MAG: patatin-like phospholipase family protein [Pseudomonadota bacterium]